MSRFVPSPVPGAASRNAAASGAAYSSHGTCTATATATHAPAMEHGQRVRTGIRRPYRVPCRIRLVDQQTGHVRTVLGETINLSDGGIAMNVSIDAPVGTWVETLLPHPSGDPMFLCGRVVHCRRTLATSFELGVVVTNEEEPAF